ncbi:MAG: Type restriction endonuclease and methyltransferase DrdVIII, partial [Deinococcota bacterium]
TPNDGKFAVRYQTETLEIPVHFSLYDLDPVNTETGFRISPHGILQGHLNTTPQHLWGLVCNPEKLRLLRDNAQMTRAAYAEFDLAEIMKTEDSKAFRVLWLLLHRSRFKNASQSILENWNNQASTEGVKARDALRDQVKTAIEHLGTGFLQHNPDLYAQVKTSNAELSSLYRECLKLIYQMVFLFVTEDRDLLFAKNPDNTYTASAETRERAKHYLTRSIRTKASRTKGHPLHMDAYTGWQTLIIYLQDGFAPLGLPALGSHLFAPNRLSQQKLPNNAFYSAIRALSEISNDHTRRPVNYAGLDSEELGSIYESLLELVPSIQAGGFLTLETLAGNERKTTGSYYTPSSLIQLLLESALDPVIETATKNKSTPEAIIALKNLKIIDPACGSGHFLIAAARRIGAKLAELEEDTSIPSPSALRRATRTVIAHCIYGADINPMAIELAKVALWLESQESGKPLAFLDHRLKVGNSLLGTNPELMVRQDSLEIGTSKNPKPPLTGMTLHLPDDAFVALEGDDKTTVAELKKRNKQERKFLLELTSQKPLDLGAELQIIYNDYRELDAIEPNTLEAVKQQEAKYAAILQKTELQHSKLLADAWCAAFMIAKTPNSPKLTSNTLQLLQQSPNAAELEPIRNLVQSTAQQYQFLHPHIEFADVFTSTQKGFDCVLGNPPWERIKLQEKEWFAQRVPEIAQASNAATRGEKIKALKTEQPKVFAEFKQAIRQAEAESHFIRSSNRYPLTGRGDINTYAIFSELNRDNLNPNGSMGIIVPTGIATDDTTKFFFQDLVEKQSLSSLYDFENREKLFLAVDSRMKFCTLSVSGLERPNQVANFVFFALNAEDTKDPNKRFTLSPNEIALLNPNTRTAPVFRSSQDANITRSIYQRIPVLLNETTGENPWGISFMAMFHMSNDSGLFRTAKQLEAQGYTLEGNHFVLEESHMMPLYEAKLMHQFDHRFATYTESGDTRDMTDTEKENPRNVPLPRYWVDSRDISKATKTSLLPKWMFAYRWIARSTDIRTLISSCTPVVGFGNSSPVMIWNSLDNPSGFIGCWSSFICDFVVRQKLGGANMTFGTIQQLPVLPPSAFTPERLGFITPRVLELTFTASDLSGFATDLGYTGQPFTWNPERRFWLRAELDALYFMLYGIDKADVDYIMDTFPIVRRKDEAAYGEYRTKNAILEIYDVLQGLGLERLLEYQSRVGEIAGGWKPL